MSANEPSAVESIQPLHLSNVIEDLLSSEPATDVRELLQTLLVYTGNLIKYPTDKRFHKINVLNIHFEERVGHLSLSRKCMESIGFVRRGYQYDFVAFGDTPDGGTNETKSDDVNPVGAGGDQQGGVDRMCKDSIALLKECETRLIQFLKTTENSFENLIRLPEDHEFRSVKGAGVHCEQGKRDNMEDDEILVDSFASVADQGYFAVYDGHGGRQTVDFVVRALHANLAHILEKHPYYPIADALNRSYLQTDGQLRRQNIIQSGTTSASCLIRHETKDGQGIRVMYVANVGDTRAVLCRAGQAHRLTVDHKPTLPEERARIEQQGGFLGRANRVNGMLAISRALGDHILKHNDIVTAVPFQQKVELSESDTYLLLCCDGVWDVMEDQEAVDFVLENMKLLDEDDKAPSHINDKCKEVSRKLVMEALGRRSMDNVTVMVVAL